MSKFGDWIRRMDGQTLKRDLIEPLEGTNMSMALSALPNFYAENGLFSFSNSFVPGNAQLAYQVWVSSICIHKNAQQISAMPLVYNGPFEPAWVSNPDPNWYPNGIGSAVYAIVSQMYAHGFSCLYITDFYADGFARTWTVLDSASVSVRLEDGRREYKLGERILDPNRVVQIDRNPGPGLTGTPAIRAYAQNAWGLLAAGNQSMTVNQGGTPKFYLKSLRKIDKSQADKISSQWASAASARNGLPPVVPPELEPTEMSFNPSELALLDTQEWNARVLATAYGVPSVILNMALQGGLTYQNPMALMQMWWLTELRTTAKQIEDAFSARLLPRGQWVNVDASDITQGPVSEDDPQLADRPKVAKASPSQQPPSLTAIGGGGG